MKSQLTFFLLLISFSSSYAQNAGDISPNAKIVDVNKMYSFNDGFAVVTKGTADALLKPDGSLFIPFNKYTFESVSVLVPDKNGNYFDYPDKGFINGFAVARHVEQEGKGFPPILINLQGREPFPPTISSMDPFVNGKTKVYVTNGKISSGYFLFTNGTLIQQIEPISRSTTNDINYFDWEQTDVFRCKCPAPYGKMPKYGYTDIRGKLIIPCQYDVVGSFSEGIAKVMKIDNFGEEKWGFINSTGKQITGLIFSQEPRDFHCGLAAVIPKNGDEYSYAYIDKSGQIKIKSKSKGTMKIEKRSSHDFYDYLDFKSGYARWTPKSFIDTLGTVHDLSKLKGKFSYKGTTFNEISGDSFFFDTFEVFQNGLINFSWSGLHGLADINGNIIIPPVFQSLKHFDPVSKLAYATTWDDKKGKETEGYINRQGIFVIVKGIGSKW